VSAGELADVFLGRDGTGRIAGAVDDEDGGVVRDGFFYYRWIERQVVTQGDGFRRPVRDFRQGVVGDEAGVGEDDLLSLIDVSFEGEMQGLAASGGGDHVAGVHLDILVAFVFRRDGLPEGFDPLVGRVGVGLPGLDRLDSALPGVVRRREVGLTETEVDGVLAGGLEHLADAADGDGFDARSELAHSSPSRASRSVET